MTESVWSSLHLFAPSIDAAAVAGWGDQLAAGPVARAVERTRQRGWVERFFFLRYAEWGHHLRLRIRSTADAADAVRAELADAFLLDPRPEQDEHGPFHRSAHPDVELARWLSYQPETARYGGPEGVAAAERFFDASSRAALALLGTSGGDGALDSGRRAAFGVLAMAATLHGVAGDAELAISLARDYSRGWIASLEPEAADPAAHRTTWERAFDANWRRQADGLGAAVGSLWSALDAGEAPAPFADLAAAAATLRGELDGLAAAGRLAVREPDWPAGLASLVPSYLHMTSNRLGIDTFQEAYLGYLGARSIEQTGSLLPINP